MFLKCFGGPMDGAIYRLDGKSDKPDGLWFNGLDENSRENHNEYKLIGPAPGDGPVVFIYEYDGQVVVADIEFDTDEPE